MIALTISIFVNVFFMLSWIALFLWFSHRAGNLVNPLTPGAISFFPAYFVFEFIYLYWSGSDNFWAEYTFLYTCSLLYVGSFVFGYMIVPGALKSTKCVYVYTHRYPVYALLLTSAAFFLYLPILVEFKQYIFYPRIIYELTRTGYGHFFYTSLLSSMLAVVFLFYSFPKNKLYSILLIIVNLCLLLLHGNKTPIFYLVLSWLFYYSYVLGKKISIKFMFFVAFSMSVVIFLFFFLTFNSNISEILIKMAYYSDYNRNAIYLMNSDVGVGYGRYLVESQIFSRLPRIIYPDKPEYFGYLELARQVFPSRTAENVGLPSFGLGEYYADFGYFSLIAIPLISFCKGVLTGYAKNFLNKTGDIYYFIVFVFMSGIDFISLGGGWLFYEHCIIAVVIFFMLKTRFFSTQNR